MKNTKGGREMAQLTSIYLRRLQSQPTTIFFANNLPATHQIVSAQMHLVKLLSLVQTFQIQNATTFRNILMRYSMVLQ